VKDPYLNSVLELLASGELNTEGPHLTPWMNSGPPGRSTYRPRGGSRAATTAISDLLGADQNPEKQEPANKGS
jgi:hypothetical protein